MKLFLCSTEKDEEFGSEWKTYFDIGIWKQRRGITISLDRYLTKFEGKDRKEWMVSAKAFSILLSPWQWEISNGNNYYDGNHHWIQVGPFQYAWDD